MARRTCVMLLCLLAWACSGNLRVVRGSGDRAGSRPTAQLVREKKWWPTSSRPAAEDYAGPGSCTACHTGISTTQQGTHMAHASRRATDTDALTRNVRISSSQSGFETVIATTTRGSTYTVARGGEAMTGRIIWTMGDGALGSTFILQMGADLFESQLSYYSAIAGLDLTPGHASSASYGLEHALGERQSLDTAQHCFGCHTTASSLQGRFDPGHAIPGLTCEACHGPGARHIRAMQEGRINDGREAIFNPAGLGAKDQVDFCGACHRSPADVKAAKDFVPLNIRFQPYRLAKSRCWSRADARLSCFACHNPHENLVQDVKSYDAKCLACHAKKGSTPSQRTEGPAEMASALVCTVGTERCVTCHMPRYQVQAMHGAFTDHFIRIVRPGEAFPL